MQYPASHYFKIALGGLGVFLACIAALILILFAFKAFGRYQARADAKNAVVTTNTRTKAVIAQANQRYQASIGIKRAQVEIAKTLTPLYVQFEAIEAQKAIATSGKNNTVVYVPAGTNGTPVITQDSQNHPTPAP